MNALQFWNLIEESNQQAGGDPVEQASILTRMLTDHAISEIFEFETFLLDHVWQAHDARLMAASAIVIEDMDDDDFHDFNLWLISRGRAAYEQSLKDPETLADLVDQDQCVLAFEIGTVAAEAYRRKTGNDDFHCVYEGRPSPELKNESFVWQTKEGYADVNRLRVLFPRLWAKFGERSDSE